MNLGSRATLKSLGPGGVIFLAAVVLLQGNILSLSSSVITTYYWVVFLAGLLFAWRFHSSPALFAVMVLLLSHQALEFFSHGRPASVGQGHIALEAIALLLPLNYALLAIAKSHRLDLSTTARWFGLFFMESVVVAILCRPAATTAPAFLDDGFLPSSWFHGTRLPQAAWLAFILAIFILVVRFFLYRKPVEGGLLWSLTTAFLGLQAGGGGRTGSAYFATAALILVCALVENSYALAYQDELTGLPSRRAFHDAVAHLKVKENYTVAMVDIDHFKKFNDTYGHETGDQVLRMVAARLARVSGGGQAFRIGGEEFAILFCRESPLEVLPHLEVLRMEIEASAFHVRGGEERRAVSHGVDRRREVRSRRIAVRKKLSPAAAKEFSITVSLGVAGPNARTRHIEQVVQSADQALYRAKRAGRNRVEIAAAERSRANRNIA